jgi:hypothetical protein
MDVETLNKVIAELNEVIDMIESRDKIEAMYGAIVARDAVRKLLDGVRGEEAA